MVSLGFDGRVERSGDRSCGLGLRDVAVDDPGDAGVQVDGCRLVPEVRFAVHVGVVA